MANTLAYAQIFQEELDLQMIQGSTMGWMEPNSKMVKYSGGNEIKIPSVLMDGLADYDRENGYVKGSVSLTWETHTLTQDRGRKFQIDAMDVDETNFVVTAGSVMGKFQKTRVIPEVDAYRYGKIASTAITKKVASGGYTPADSTILNKLLYDIATVQDKIGDGVQLIITMPFTVGVILNASEKLQKRIDVVDFKQGGISTKIKAIDGIPIMFAPSARLKTAFKFNDGKTEDEEAGGFESDPTAKTVNWLITAQDAPIAVSKTDTPRIFDPQTNQDAHAWRIDYRKYHDLWIPEDKVSGIFANVKEAL